ncbi:MAG: hypothetical protein Q9191_004146 [Dirinaria sp. TL-2023a]
MPYNLKGRNVLITGGSRGLGALLAEKFAKEGSNIAVNYVENEGRARQVADKVAKDYGAKAVVIKGVSVNLGSWSWLGYSSQADKTLQDVGLSADCERMVEEAIKGLGGLDVIISNAMWAVNCKANLHLLRKALPTLKSNPDGGVLLVTASIAGISQTGSSMAYAVSKAAALHLTKCLAATQGPKIRVNAVLPGLLLTEWGQKFTPEQVKAVKDKSVLKMEV